jgi:hypothetical protein
MDATKAESAYMVSVPLLFGMVAIVRAVQFSSISIEGSLCAGIGVLQMRFFSLLPLHVLVMAPRGALLR